MKYRDSPYWRQDGRKVPSRRLRRHCSALFFFAAFAISIGLRYALVQTNLMLSFSRGKFAYTHAAPNLERTVQRRGEILLLATPGPRDSMRLRRLAGAQKAPIQPISGQCPGERVQCAKMDDGAFIQGGQLWR